MAPSLVEITGMLRLIKTSTLADTLEEQGFHGLTMKPPRGVAAISRAPIRCRVAGVSGKQLTT